MLFQHLDKNNLHHAYLIEGTREEVVPEILELMRSLNIETSGNPDFQHISVDSFKIKDARNLKAFGSEKGFSVGKKIFLISANNFLLEAQNALLKVFEEPIENTHFFLVVPDINSLLQTLVSRFYLIKSEAGLKSELDEANKFISLSLGDRINFIKELLADSETESEDEDSEDSVVGLPSGSPTTELVPVRLKALKFLNALEITLHNSLKNSSGFTLPGVSGGTHTIQNSLENCFSQIFKVREFLRMPGSSAKSLMESVALVVPKI